MAKHTEFQKRVKKFVEEESQEVHPDKVVCKANGTVEVKYHYFYTFGMTADKWAAKVHDALLGAGIEAKVAGRNDFREWPKDSYFTAIVAEVDAAPVRGSRYLRWLVVA